VAHGDGNGRGAEALDAAASGFTLPVLPSIAQLPPSTRAQPVPSSAESRVGQAMHRMLEGLPLGATALDPAQQRAAAREFALDASQARQAAAMAAAILAGEGAWAWDAALVDWVGNEVALTRQGQTLRLDRLVRRRDTGAWWVLDYKSAAAPLRQSALVQQLQDYRAALQAVLPGAPVHAAFLTGQGAVVVLD